MSKSAIRILRAAAEMVGGMPELAGRLGMSQTVLAQYVVGYRRMPDPLLLKVLDIVLAEREETAWRPAGFACSQRSL